MYLQKQKAPGDKQADFSICLQAIVIVKSRLSSLVSRIRVCVYRWSGCNVSTKISKETSLRRITAGAIHGDSGQ